MGTIWEIASHDGWNAIRCREIAGCGLDDFVLTEYSCHGSFWDRSTLASDGIVKPSLTNDFELKLCQVMTPLSSFTNLRFALDAWLREPGSLTVALGSMQDQQLIVEIGRREQFICSDANPVFTLKYISSRLSSSQQFVVDESCVRIASDLLLEFELNRKKKRSTSGSESPPDPS